MGRKGAEAVADNITLSRKWSCRFDGELNAFPGQDARSLSVWADFCTGLRAGDETAHQTRQLQGYPHSMGLKPGFAGSRQRSFGADSAGLMIGYESEEPSFKELEMPLCVHR